MIKEEAKRLARGLFGAVRLPELAVPNELRESGRILPLRPMVERLVQLTERDFGMYAWSREPLSGKFDRAQKMHYIAAAGSCGRNEAKQIKDEYQTGEAAIIARQMKLQVQMPAVPAGGGHVIFAQYVEPDEITIFADAVERAERLIKEFSLADLLGGADVKNLLLAHELFHAVEYRKEDTIYTKTEKVQLWRKPFSNRSRLVCLGEMAGMAFAKALTGVAFCPYLLDVLLMYGYHEAAATALYEEILEIAGAAE